MRIHPYAITYNRERPGECGKRTYLDKRAVQSQMNLFRRVRGRHGRPEGVRAYYCVLCRGWHLTKANRFTAAVTP